MAGEAGKSGTATAERVRKTSAERAPYHRGNVRRDLIDAARRLVETETLEAVTARRLCREVNVSSANFYNHFASLDDLFLEVAADGFAQRAAENQRLLKRGGSRDDILVQIAQNLVEFSLNNSQLFRLMFGQIGDVGANQRYTAAADESFRVIAEIVMGEDLYVAEDLPHSHEVCQPAYAYFAFIYGLARCMSQGLISNPSGTRAERRRFVETLTRQMIRGLGVS
ncbi:MAG: TetR/AcrR family transcriptional regulator [Hyphomonadaceae bacterium]